MNERRRINHSILSTRGWRVMSACLLLAMFLSGCCRTIAIRDAEMFTCMGKQARIAAYPTGGDGYIASFPVSLYLTARYGYLAHAQAQVWQDGKWKWVEGGKLLDKPTYSMKRVTQDQKERGIDFYWYSVQEFRDFLEKEGLKVPAKTECKG